MKYYLAARYSRKHELQGYADQLGRADCTSSWLYENAQCSALAEVPMFHHKNPLMTQLAREDLGDIDRADVLVLFSDPMFPGQPRGSKHVEFGYALAQGLRCVVIGPLENLFHHLPCVKVFKNWEEFVEKEFPNDPPEANRAHERIDNLARTNPQASTLEARMPLHRAAQEAQEGTHQERSRPLLHTHSRANKRVLSPATSAPGGSVASTERSYHWAEVMLDSGSRVVGLVPEVAQRESGPARNACPDSVQPSPGIPIHTFAETDQDRRASSVKFQPKTATPAASPESDCEGLLGWWDS